MHDRDLDITKFSYFSYRRLKKTLGEFDAVVECNEIAIKEFLEKIKEDKSETYMHQLSIKHGVKVDNLDFVKFDTRIRQYYILSVFQQAEQYFKNFKEEYMMYFEEIEWKPRLKEETLLGNIIRNLDVDIPTDLKDIYEYYRIVRNYMAHTDRDTQELEKRYGIIQKNENSILKKLNINKSPNYLNTINFDDFFILTNIVKHIAFILTTKSKPTNDRIAEILLKKSEENNSTIKRGFKRLLKNNDRLERSIKNFVVTNFGRFCDSDLSEIFTKFRSLLA
jgi:hypothetical protein